jgi:serine/threonine protein kinase
MPILNDGDLVRDTYAVERLLGEGAFAEVYRVRHRFMGRQAMKVFKVPGVDLAAIEQDLKEALLLSPMRHSNLTEIYDANVLSITGQQFGYFTMNYMPGGTLDRYWRSFGAKLMPVEQAVEIVRQAARGLALAHAQNPPIIHRDIKPPNILIGFGAGGISVRLSDFGLAKAVNPLTMLASSRGTVGFKPPESFDDMDSRAADIWALGTTLYLILTDEMPFPMLDGRDISDAARFLRPIRPPSLYNAAVDGRLESVIFRCLAARPADRYADAAELLRDLDRWTPGEAPPGTSLSGSDSGGKRAIAERSRHDLQAEARQALREAERLATDPTRLALAADLLEEAISKDPTLGETHVGRLQLWRKGIMQASAPSRHK